MTHSLRLTARDVNTRGVVLLTTPERKPLQQPTRVLPDLNVLAS